MVMKGMPKRKGGSTKLLLCMNRPGILPCTLLGQCLLSRNLIYKLLSYVRPVARFAGGVGHFDWLVGKVQSSSSLPTYMYIQFHGGTM